MVNFWILAAGAAVTAAALVVRRGRRRAKAASIEPVSEEWLSIARGRGDESW